MNKKKYQLIIFDWEGTLSDTLGQVLDSVATEAARLGFGSFNPEIARLSFEIGLVNAIKRLFPELSPLEQHELIEAVQRNLMSRHGETFLIPGAKQLISALSHAQILLAIATNKGHQGLHRALLNSGLAPFFNITRSASQTAPKPDPTMLIEILDELVILPENALMIGDSAIDMEMAGRLKMDAIGVNFYHQDGEELLRAGALQVFNDYRLLADFLLGPLYED